MAFLFRGTDSAIKYVKKTAFYGANFILGVTRRDWGSRDETRDDTRGQKTRLRRDWRKSRLVSSRGNTTYQ